MAVEENQIWHPEYIDRPYILKAAKEDTHYFFLELYLPSYDLKKNSLQVQYLFRNRRLRHLRVEQFNRYFSPVFGGGAGDVAALAIGEDTRDEDESDPLTDTTHQHYDARAQAIAVGTRLGGTIQEASLFLLILLKLAKWAILLSWAELRQNN